MNGQVGHNNIGTCFTTRTDNKQNKGGGKAAFYYMKTIRFY